MIHDKDVAIDVGSSGSDMRVTRLLVVICAALIGLIALLPSVASAANPSILNTGTGCAGQERWLVSCATQGESGSGGDVFRISALVSHDADKTIASLLTLDTWPTSDTGTPGNVRTANNTAPNSNTRPNISSGYPRSRINLNFPVSTSGTGMSCPAIGSPSRRTSNRYQRTFARDSSSQNSATVGSIVKFTANGNCLFTTGNNEDFAYIYAWPGLGSSGSCASPTGSNFNNQTTPGSTLTFCYQGDDPDTTGDTADFQGVNWRLRNLRTGATTTPQTSCPGGGDNSVKPLQVTFPDRGAFVVEAELLDADGCGQNQNGGYWFTLGTADVNGASIPAPGLQATRPQINGNTTVTLTPPTDPDSADGGGAQILQWDLNENAGDGVSGFEADNVAGAGAIFSTDQTRTINTTGMSPGLHTVRARVIDNGAMDAADAIRRTSPIATATFRVDSPPVAAGQTIGAEAGKAKAITLGATDADGDTLTYSIDSGPSHGTLTGTGANRTYTPAADYAGPDSFTWHVTDGFGGSSSATVSIDVAPDTNITSGPSGPINSTGPSWSFDSPTSGAAFECNFDGAGYTSCASPQAFTGLADGEHTFLVRAVAAGNTDPTPASRTIVVDTADPQTAIDAGPTGYSTTAAPTFEFSADQAGSTFECRVDADAFTGCTSPHVTGSLPDGLHTFEVRATDPAGNTDPTPASRTFTVDTTFPETSIDSGPSGPTNTSNPQFTFSSDDPTATFECRVDVGAFASCTSPYTTPNLPDGPHTVEVRATDPADNTDVSPASRSFTIDTVPPETSLDAAPSGPISDDTPTFEFSSDKPGSTFECRIDAAPFADCATPFTSDELDEGPHTFQVRAVDVSGNRDATPPSAAFTVDTIDPVTSIDSGPSGTVSDATPTFEFSSDEPGSTFECRVDDGTFELCASPFTTPSLGEGPHTIEVRALDAAGNTDQSPETRTFTVDTQTPGTSLDDGPSGTIGTATATFEFSSGEAGATFECKLDAGEWEECASPQTFHDLSTGEHTVSVRAVDGAGNIDPSPPSRTFTVDTSVAQTSIDSGPSGSTNLSTAHLTFSSDDPDATFECRLDTPTWTDCTSPADYSGLADGEHTFRVRAVGANGHTDGTPATRSWAVDTQGPAVSFDRAPGALTSDSSPTFEFAADESGSTFECRLDSTAPGDWASCTSPSTTPGLSEGAHTYEVRATDSTGNIGAAAPRSFTVDTVAPGTQITGGPSGTTSAGNATFTFNSTEPGSSFVCTLDGSATACTSPKSYSGLDDGEHTFSVVARDAAGNDDASPATSTWTIAGSAPPDTQITGGPSGTVGSPNVSFRFTSSSAGATFECALDGSSFSACTSPRAYTGLTSGEHTFAVRSATGASTDPTPATRAFTVAATGGRDRGSSPKIEMATGKLKLKKIKPIQVATVACVDGTCTVSSSSATLTVGKRKFTLKLTAPAEIAPASSAPITAKLKGKAKKALAKKGKGKLAVSLEVSSSDAPAATANTTLKLKTKKKKR